MDDILFTQNIHDITQNEFLDSLKKKDYNIACNHILYIYQLMHQNIPESKRISFGSYSVVVSLGKYLYEFLKTNDLSVFEIASNIYNKSNERKSKGVSLCIISYTGLDDYKPAMEYIKKAAIDDDWEVREFAAGFIHKITHQHPEEIKKYYLKYVKSEDENLRRFVSESLRPVSENKWMKKQSAYPLSIIKHLFKEKKAYPRTSVGNSLSDWARINPSLAYEIIQELAASGDKNSYWIAYRACRNLVKKEPLKVMDILKIDEYRYKKAIYKREHS